MEVATTGSSLADLGRRAKEASRPLALASTAAKDAGLLAAADLLGIAAETGTLTVGKAADIIAVDGDPLADANELAKVKWVMARGQVID